jgi:hypothetical protein
MGGVGWGHAEDGLRSEVLVPVGRKKVGEPIPVLVTIENQGGSQTADGSACLGPVLRIDVSRNGWRKSALVPVHQLNPDAYLSLEKGQKFHYSLDVSTVVDMDVPGDYLVMGGYDSTAATRFKRAWQGSPFTSPPYRTVTIVPADNATPVVARDGQVPEPPVNRETAWGDTVRGLRCKVAAGAGEYVLGQGIPLTLTIENLGTPDHADGAAQLFPSVDIWARRAGWEKHVTVKLDIPNRLRIKRGDRFVYRLDLAEVLDMTAAGEYSVSAGHLNFIVSDSGDWTGTVRSPFLDGIVITVD